MIRWLVDKILAPRKSPADLMRFGPDAIGFDQCFSGVALIGATGAGKTSFLELLLQALAEHPSRPGILHCCAKADEVDRAEKIARRASSHKFVRFSADGSHALDLFGYLQGPLQQSADGIARFCDRMAGLAAANTGSGDDKTWQMQATLLLTHGLSLFAAAGEKPTPQGLFEVVSSIPKDPVTAASDAFLTHTVCGQLIVRGQRRYQASLLTPAEQAAFTNAVNYVFNYAPGLGDRFIGSVVGTAVTGLAPFLQPPFSAVFGSTTTSLPPDVLLDGAYVALDFPAVHGPNAYVAQAAFVQLTRMMLMAKPVAGRRPVVIVCDECQWLVSPDWDARVQTIARSHDIISLSACQGPAPLIDAFGGNEATRVRALAFLGNHATHFVFNTVSDVETRDHYGKLFGTTRQLLFNGGQQPDPNPGFLDRALGCDFTPTVGWGEQLLPVVPPEEFGRLKRGGRDHRFRIEAFLFQAGRRFSNGRPFLKVEFEQDLTP